jgi:hypothetical protein
MKQLMELPKEAVKLASSIQEAKALAKVHQVMET